MRDSVYYVSPMKTTLTLLAALTLLGCASRPVIDERGIDRAKYDADLAECENYRADAEKRAESNFLTGAGDWVGRGGMVKRCLAGRGYKVLN